VAITLPLLFVNFMIAPESGSLKVSVKLPEIEALGNKVGLVLGNWLGALLGAGLALSSLLGESLGTGLLLGDSLGEALEEAVGKVSTKLTTLSSPGTGTKVNIFGRVVFLNGVVASTELVLAIRSRDCSSNHIAADVCQLNDCP
jgi:hypothetical protein